MSTDMVVQDRRGVALEKSSDWQRKLDLVQKTVAPGLTAEEFQLFCHIAKARQLDPLQRQIYAVKRKTWDSEKGGYDEKVTIQVGIDGFRAIANRTGLYMPSDKPPLIEDVDKPTMRATVWVKKFHPASGSWNEFAATAYFREFCQMRWDKQDKKYVPMAMWAKMPLTMIEKCAEAKALRRGWPEELGQVYVPEEINEHPQTIEAKEIIEEDVVDSFVSLIEGSGSIDEMWDNYDRAGFGCGMEKGPDGRPIPGTEKDAAALTRCTDMRRKVEARLREAARC